MATKDTKKPFNEGLTIGKGPALPPAGKSPASKQPMNHGDKGSYYNKVDPSPSKKESNKK